MPYATYRFNKIIAAETIRFIVTVAIVVYKGLKLVVYRMLTKQVLDTSKDFICFIMNVFTIRPQVGGELWNSALLSEMKDNIRWKIDGIKLVFNCIVLNIRI